MINIDFHGILVFDYAARIRRRSVSRERRGSPSREMTPANFRRAWTKEKAESPATLFVLFCKNNDAPRAAASRERTMAGTSSGYRIMPRPLYSRPRTRQEAADKFNNRTRY
jgi:hypothetical protein